MDPHSSILLILYLQFLQLHLHRRQGTINVECVSECGKVGVDTGCPLQSSFWEVEGITLNL